MQVTHRDTKLNYAIPIKSHGSKWNIFARARYVETLGGAADYIADLGEKSEEPHWQWAIQELVIADASPSDKMKIIFACRAMVMAIERDGQLLK